MSDSGNGTPPGWYPDGEGGQRWWDGTQWGPIGQPPASTPPPGAPPSTPAYGTYAAPDGAAASSGVPAAHPDASQPTRSRTPLYAVLAVAAVAIIVFAVTAFAAPGFLVGGGASSDDPVETVNAFLDASKDQDCDAAKDLVTADLRKQIEDQGCGDAGDATELGIDIENITYDVGEAEIDGDKASVPVAITAEEFKAFGDLTVNYLLLKQDGAWLVDDFETDLGTLDDFPTDLPTDLGSDFPTDLPTDFLSDFPTDFPTDFLSDFPTDFPTDFLSDFPTDFPTE